MKRLLDHLDLQARISLVLVAVIVPIFLIVTIAENRFTLPILEGEIRQIGIHTGKVLAAEIVSGRMLSRPNAAELIENSLFELLFTEPDVARIDVIVKDQATGMLKVIATNIDEEPSANELPFTLVDAITSQLKITDATGSGVWDIHVPIEHRSKDPRGPKKILGMVHVVVSTKLITRIIGILWKTTAVAAALSVVSLILVLSYFLRKTIMNDRLLRKAESENSKLTEQVDELQRKLMINEKLAVMGQLTASFAHEIGTPLNAIGGHLQLLKEEVSSLCDPQVNGRFSIVFGQLKKIESIVKGFLHQTAKPESQKQLVDLNQLVEKTVQIVCPRIESLGIVLQLQLDLQVALVRAVPLDLEQIFLNLLNNSIDSIQTKYQLVGETKCQLRLQTKMSWSEGKTWAIVIVYDTGVGIRKMDLRHVLKPFFTTKRPGEGTGLGLTICEQLVQKYGGDLNIHSKEGAWTKVTLRIPYPVNS